MRLPAIKAEHEYELCDDPDCERFPCRVYRKGYAAGFSDGESAGFAAGFAEGHEAGFAEGHEAGYADGSAAAG